MKSNYHNDSRSTTTTNNDRLDIHTKVIKCSFCDSISSLKSFRNDYVCEACINDIKSAMLAD